MNVKDTVRIKGKSYMHSGEVGKIVKIGNKYNYVMFPDNNNRPYEDHDLEIVEDNNA